MPVETIRRQPLLAIAALLLASWCANLYLKWHLKDGLLGPEYDRSGLHYWAWSVLEAEAWGLGALIDGTLSQRPDTKLFQLLGPAYYLPTRLMHVVSAALVAITSVVLGRSTESMVLLGVAVATCVSLLVSGLAWGQISRRSGAPPLAIVSLVFMHALAWPYLIAQTTWVGYHAIGLLMICTVHAAAAWAGGVHAASWSMQQKCVIGFLMVACFYSSHFFPALYLICFALVSLGRQSSSEETSWRSEAGFWVAIGLCAAPAVLLTLARRSGVTTDLERLTQWSPADATTILIKALVSGGGLILLALLAPTGGIRTMFHNEPTLVLYSICALSAIALAFSQPHLDRLLVYLLPALLPLAHAAQACLDSKPTRWAKPLIVCAALVPIGLQAGWLIPSRPSTRIVASLTSTQEYVAVGKEVTAWLSAPELRAAGFDDRRKFVFRNRDLTALVNVRQGVVGSPLTGFERYVEALEKGTESSFLMQRVGNSRLDWPLAFVADPDTLPLLASMHAHLHMEEIAHRRIAGRDWSVFRTTAADRPDNSRQSTPSPHP